MKKILLSSFSLFVLFLLISFTGNQVSSDIKDGKNVKWMTFEEAIEATSKFFIPDSIRVLTTKGCGLVLTA